MAASCAVSDIVGVGCEGAVAGLNGGEVARAADIVVARLELVDAVARLIHVHHGRGGDTNAGNKRAK